ncbi:MAG TPA: hypothetical protein VH641_05330 [Streptosporangiaceae bacterium]|jgi:hypothetical protein
MPGYLAHQGATVICAHGGQAQPSAVNPRVRLSGQAAVQLPTPYLVSGCALPSSAGGPCTAGTWTAGTARVRSLGQPLVIQGGTGTCVPTGAPLQVTAVQSRVRGS